ncbi:tRNA(Ile)(2)-agmatinylcytidine synthase [Acidianus sp. RZ1]|uniref:tRNA(Ile)(2)-agmatinylcytidine synthase n=1 Tax=Acidianus sp. RZ1 TaxID=1540082 RepID=UPI0014911329|nr:tRNA(Ile)(2)-agmatinylcytidine synthase [Acidianus sp. RZ1]NON62465.1 DUF1743 domain-containing protein [Acidianus sp. RZ1]
MIYHLGIDDHDSPFGGCTTHFGLELIRFMQKKGIKIIGYPRLVRLNPNVPWKTKGNAAVALTIEADMNLEELGQLIWDKSIEYVKNISHGFEYKRKPGVVIVKDCNALQKMDVLQNFYIKAVYDIIPIDLAIKVAKSIEAIYMGSRGIIGSLASLGFEQPYTYELLTYRKMENWKKPRGEVDLDSLIKFDEEYFPYVFGNVDYIKGKPLILSHGNDPVLYGIRGTRVNSLLEGMKKIRVNEEFYDFLIFKTNQGTDSHAKKGNRIYQMFYDKVIVKEINIIKGGDVIINTVDNQRILVYKETGELNSAAKLLRFGDEIEVLGGIKPSAKFNKIIEAERIIVLKLSNKNIERNPRCPRCNSSSTSRGKNKGFKCKKCGFIFNEKKSIIEESRELSIGTYQARYYRHLTKPIFLQLENK